MEKMRIGVVGQGFVGRSYANAFEARGYSVARYSLEKEYLPNRGLIADCSIVFLAVPTPTTPQGFDDSAIHAALRDVGLARGIVVIKSTVLPGTTETIQSAFPQLAVLYSPEFLSEDTATIDVANPFCTIIGMPRETEVHREAARALFNVLPHADKTLLCTSLEAELIKYAHNTLAYAKVVMVNLLYDFGRKLGADWAVVKEGLMSDPMIAPYHLDPVHKNGRGAGGNCLIKDFEAFLQSYEKIASDSDGSRVLQALRRKNLSLLQSTAKSLNILKQIYGGDTDAI